MITHYDKLTLVEHANKADFALLEKNWDLNPSIFNQTNSAVEVARFTKIESTKLKQAHLFVSFDLCNYINQIEKDLIPIIAIINHDQLFLISSQSFNKLQKKLSSSTSKPYPLLLHSLLLQEQHLLKKFDQLKVKIDLLDQAARRTSKTEELIELTDLTREIVYIRHTLDDQHQPLFELLDFIEEQGLAEQSLINNVRTTERRLRKRSSVYSDLLDSISGLFTAMMDSHLNHLMKYLDTAALIISIPALISGLLGMNVGGMPAKQDEHGFWLIVFLCGVVSLIAWFFLSRKKYDK